MDKSEFNIENVIKGLMEKRKVFTSEADFQLALAMQIEKMYGDNSVICEYVPDYESELEGKDSRIHIDIFLCEKNIPIELKYRTKKDELNYYNYKISLSDQLAHDDGSYGFWRDVCRIDEFIKKKNAYEGYVIFLTNDKWYMNPDYSRCRVSYEKFNLNDKEKNDRSGRVSKKEVRLKNVPKIEAEWLEFDMGKDKKLYCYIAKINGCL